MSRVAIAEESLQTLLAKASSLAAGGDLAAAERVTRTAVAEHPESPEAALMLANVLLWRSRYADAKFRFKALLGGKHDVEARLGLAQAEYWSGDYRAAIRDFRLVSEREEARLAIAEIQSAAAPGYIAGVNALYDDQPYRSSGASTRIYVFSDPLTRWDLELDNVRRSAGDMESVTPSLRAQVQTAAIPSRLTVRAAVGALRFGDGSTRLLPLLGADLELRGSTVTMTASREAVLRTAASLESDVTADVISLRWTNGDRLAVHAERSRFFDGNSGGAVDAFILRRFGHVLAGASAAWRDTEQSRFNGRVYDPYYTPQGLREMRVVVGSTFHRASASADVHVDAGAGREAVVGRFYPWRAAVNVSIPLHGRAMLSLAAERSSSAFYTANEIRASVAGRF